MGRHSLIPIERFSLPRVAFIGTVGFSPYTLRIDCKLFVYPFTKPKMSRFAGCLLRLLERSGRRGAGTRGISVWSGLTAGASSRSVRRWILLGTGASSLALLAYNSHLERRRSLGLGLVMPQLQAAEGGGGGSEKEGEDRQISGWERRFRDFASLHYKGERYMTAQDFLESLVQDAPRCTLEGGR